MRERADERLGEESRVVIMRFHERLTQAAFAQAKAGRRERMLWRRSSPIESIVVSISAAALRLSSAISRWSGIE